MVNSNFNENIGMFNFSIMTIKRSMSMSFPNWEGPVFLVPKSAVKALLLAKKKWILE